MYTIVEDGILKGGRFIPAQDGNRDWDEYLAWIEAGNQPALATRTLAQAKQDATIWATREADRLMEESGLIPQSKFSAEMVADIAFIVMTWKEAGSPAEMPASIAERVGSEAAIYNISPLQMVGVWEQKWLQMRNGLAPILAQRRARLLAIELATSVEEVDAIWT